ncbi:hypothetical protein BX666DRAFT_2116477 [Dichotomocladium elegans]|nr:hypothetical protein BX666DRAFT_2116477 [Dichotomocladium elegans]
MRACVFCTMPCAEKSVTTVSRDTMLASNTLACDKPLSFFFDRFPRLLKRATGSRKNSRVGPDIWDDEEDDLDGSNSGDDLDKEMYKVYLATVGKCKRYRHQRQRQQQQQQQQQRPPYNLQIQLALARVLQKTGTHKKVCFEENSRLLSMMHAAVSISAIAGGRKPSASTCRYLMMLLETPVDKIVQGQHPVRQALLRRRKPFLEATVVITPCTMSLTNDSPKKEGGSYWSRILSSKTTDKKQNALATAETTTTTPIAAGGGGTALVVGGKTTMVLCASSLRSTSVLTAAGDDQDNVPLGLLRKQRVVA